MIKSATMLAKPAYCTSSSAINQTIVNTIVVEVDALDTVKNLKHLGLIFMNRDQMEKMLRSLQRNTVWRKMIKMLNEVPNDWRNPFVRNKILKDVSDDKHGWIINRVHSIQHDTSQLGLL